VPVRGQRRVVGEADKGEGASPIDAIYEKQRVAIELDGVRGHDSYAQLVDPHDQDLIEAELDRLGIPRVDF
jgi:hypothetical protein